MLSNPIGDTIRSSGRHLSFLLLPIMIFAAIYNAAAQSEPSQVLLALSKTDHTLAIVDPATLKVLARVPVGQDPHEVVASADGKTAYVSNYGGGHFHELNVIDLMDQKALPSIDTKPLMGPHGLDFAGGKVWFTAEGSKAVGRYDPATASLDWSMGTGQDRTHMICVTANEKKIFTTNVDAGTVSLLEYISLPPPVMPAGKAPPGAGARMEWEQTLIPVSKGSEGFDISPRTNELWTVSAGDGSIAIIDTASKKVVFTIEAGIFGANRLKFTPDGRFVLISTLRNGRLHVYDAALRKEIKSIDIGHGAAGILMDPNGKRVFVACTPDNYVAVIDLDKWQVTAHIDVGGGPDGLAWASH